MSRALLPFLFPVAVIVALLVAATNSLIVYGAVLMVIVWVVVPLGYVHLRRNDQLPQSLRGAEPGRRRFPGF